MNTFSYSPGDEPPVLARCRCGEVYFSERWTALPYVGHLDDGNGGELELRTCSCNNTLAYEVPR